MTYTKEAFDTHNLGTGLPIEQQVSLGNKIKTLLVSPHLKDVEFAQKLESQCELMVSPDLHYVLTLEQIKGRAYFISRNIKYRKINITSIFNEKTENIKLYKTQARRIFKIIVKSHALGLGMENKNLKEKIGLSNLFKYLIFLYRIGYIKEAR